MLSTNIEKIVILCSLLTYYVVDGGDSIKHGCHFDVDIIQSHHVGNSPIVSSPLVADIDADGSLDIVTCAFDGTVDVVSGRDMKPHSGSHWPHLFPNHTIHASPTLFDVDEDGINDILVCTSNGELNFLKPDGIHISSKTVIIPPVWVSSEWAKDGASTDTQLHRFVQTADPGQSKTAFIACDAHILATPTLADLNGDGRKEELVLPVSYYDELDSPRTDQAYSSDHSDVVVSALVMVNLTSGDIIREVLLQLSKRSDPSPAYQLHSPTVVDLDSNHGPLEVITATSSGLVVVVDWEGHARKGFPVRLPGGAITGQISVGDLDDDGNLELVIIQRSGDITLLGNHGNKKWAGKIPEGSFPGSRLADLDGDGVLDMAIPGSDGNVWGLSGKTGAPLPHWPVYLGSRLVSNVAITSLVGSGETVDIITTGYDGNLFIISVSHGTPCVETINLEERCLAPVQVADIVPTGSSTEIVAATSHGSVLLLSTQDEMEEEGESSKRRWVDATSESKFAYQADVRGVFVTSPRPYVSGSTFTVEFEILDKPELSLQDSYVVQVIAGSITLHPNVSFSTPGLYTLQAASPVQPITTLVEVQLTNRHGEVFVDSFPVSFNTKVTDDIQWMLVIPTVAMAIILLVLYGYPEVDLLPTASSSKDR